LNTLDALILGAVQGLTEFLPISSSGHLVVAQWLLGFKEPEVFFDVVLHIGTFCAVLIVFRKNVAEILLEFFDICKVLAGKKRLPPGQTLPVFLVNSMVGKVVIGTIPAVIVGFFFKDQIEELFASPFIVGINFLITGFILLMTRWAPIYPQTYFPLPTSLHALVIGIAQAIAILPGISRSGSTISIALITGCSRPASGTFSFLLFIPAVLGAAVLQMRHVVHNIIPFVSAVTGFLSAFVVGYIALKVLLKTVLQGSFYKFSFYCFFAGIVTLVLVFIRH
jgi:undecaprenyl-diphosphatase